MEGVDVADLGDSDTDEERAGGAGGEDVGFFVEEGLGGLGGVRDVVAGAGVRAGAGAGAHEEGPVVGVAVGAGGEGGGAAAAGVEGDV